MVPTPLSNSPAIPQPPTSPSSPVQHKGPGKTQVVSKSPQNTWAVQPLPAPTSELRGLRWFGGGQKVPLGDLVLQDPMVYLASTATDGTEEPAAVDVRLPVAQIAYVPSSRELGYWPRYDGLTPGQRRIYLEWLASGRAVAPPELGYTFLFIYCLERRALVDQSDQKHIFDEIFRLRRLYANSGQSYSRSFDSYTSSFLWFLIARHPDLFLLKRVQPLMEATRFWTDDNLSIALGWFCHHQLPLPAWAAFMVAAELPQSRRSIVIKRVPEELNQLFCCRYREQFGDGIVLKSAKRDRRVMYRPSSAALNAMEVASKNATGLSSQFQPLSELWNACVEELKKLSSLRAKTETPALTVTAWEATPVELRAGLDHPNTDALYALVNELVDQTGIARIPANRVAAALGFASEKLTPSKSRKLCTIASDIGYCIEPDANLMGKGYRNDESLAVFLKTSEQSASPTRYRAAACMLSFGLSVAYADGGAAEQEVTLLMQQIQRFMDLNDEEARRLHALQTLLTADPEGPERLPRLGKEVSEIHREAIGKVLLAVVAADGVVTPAELRAVRKCYTKLGFTQNEIETAMETLAPAPEDDLVTVEPGGTRAGGEAIPLPPTQSARQKVGLKLNRSSIDAILRDTREVAELLAQAMVTEETASTEPEAPPSPIEPKKSMVEVQVQPRPNREAAVTTSDLSLPARYASFYQVLISKGEWPLDEIELLARQHGHMLSGAVEALNDWAFERLGGQLFIEDGDRLTVEKSLMS
jgi:uncharacterized tellurite resistance protein B-like protein